MVATNWKPLYVPIQEIKRTYEKIYHIGPRGYQSTFKPFGVEDVILNY